MAFFTKSDLIGLETQFPQKIQIRSNNHNHSWTLINVPGKDGSYLGEYHDGDIKTPSCEYVVLSDFSFQVELGKVYNAPYALQHVHIATSPGGERVITCDAVQIEPNATTTYCSYLLPAINLSPARHALDFGAFSFAEDVGLTLQSCDYDASADLGPVTINGNPVASDAVHGIITVNPTFWSSSETAPTVTSGSGWNLTTPWSCVGQDAGLFNWTCVYTKYLTVTEHTNP